MKQKLFSRLGSALLALALLTTQAAGAGLGPDSVPDPAEAPAADQAPAPDPGPDSDSGPDAAEESIADQAPAPGPGPAVLQTSRGLVDGLTYINTIAQHPTQGRGESYTLELAPGSGAYPITVQGDGTVYYNGTIANAIELAQARGFHVLAGVNSDFYAMSTGVPLGLAVEEGLYLSDGGEEAAVVFTEEGAALVENTRVELTLTNEANGAEVHPTRFNKQRNAYYGVWLFSSRYSTVSSRTSGAGWFVKLRILEGELTTSGSMLLTVEETFRLDGACPLEEGFLYLTAGDAANQEEAFNAFQPGDPVTLSTRCEDENLARALWATGCGDVLVRDGAVTDSAGWDEAIVKTAPRTALGVREDGTLVCHVVDGRRLNHSLGLTMEDLAWQMLELGCVWAVNLDGGGSSAMSVRLPGSSGCQVVNRPSDNTPRRCASYLLLVTDDPGDGVPVGLALPSDGSTALTGSALELGSAVAYDSGLNPVEADLSDLVVIPAAGLGTVENGVYTAGSAPGMETVLCYSPSSGLSGTAQIWVTDTLTRLDVTPSPLELKTGEQESLAVSGSFWSRPALRGTVGALFQAEGDAGSVDEAGLFTTRELAGTGTVTVTAGGLTKTVPVLVQQAYTHDDVTAEDWSYDAVEYCYAAGITTGIAANLFGRGTPISRADFVVMLYRAAGEPAAEGKLPFSDVAPEDYFAPAILWAWQNGVVSGIGDGSFGARMAITRQDAFTILGRALPLLGFEPGQADESLLEGYLDAALLSDYARAPISALTAAGVVQGGGDGQLRPADDITREQTAAILYRCHTLPQPEPEPEPIEPEPEPEPAGPAEGEPGEASEAQPDDPSGMESGESSHTQADDPSGAGPGESADTSQFTKDEEEEG